MLADFTYDAASSLPDSCVLSTSHFTGKERDTESGLDYFGARYYASGMGRFMSPDWAAKEDPVPYAKLDNPQTLDLYSYIQNNPISGVDANGHAGGDGEEDPSEIAEGIVEAREENALRPIEPTPAITQLQSSTQLDAFNKFEEDHDPSYKALGADIKKAVDAYEVGKYGDLAKKSSGDGLTIDHIPSNASNIAREEARLGRPLTAAERAAVRDQGTAVAVPSDLHQSTSPTFGGRNTPAQIQADAANPQAAAARDTQAMTNAASASNKQAAQAAAQKICTATGCR